MKIYPLCHGVYFHPPVSSFSFLKGETIMKECVNEFAPSHTKTAACIHYMIKKLKIQKVSRD